MLDCFAILSKMCCRRKKNRQLPKQQTEDGSGSWRSEGTVSPPPGEGW